MSETLTSRSLTNCSIVGINSSGALTTSELDRSSATATTREAAVRASLVPVPFAWSPPRPGKTPPGNAPPPPPPPRSEEHTSELQSRLHLVCRLLLEKKKKYAQTEMLASQHTETRTRV